MRKALGVALLLSVVGCSGISGGKILPPAFDATSSRQPVVRQACPMPRFRGQMQCYVLLRTDVASDSHAAVGSAFTPADLESAYHLPTYEGDGVTVAVVDAYFYTTAETDLEKYRARWHLPRCTGRNTCFQILDQRGKPVKPLHHPPFSPPSNDWVPEQATDVDMVSAACPKCRIILIEVKSDLLRDLAAGVRAAIKAGADVVSNSYGAQEQASAVQFSSAYDQPGHVVVASAGDLGGGLLNHGGPAMPCTFAAVVCVGGTRLIDNGGTWSETVWNTLSLDECNGPCGATGSGCSTITQKPTWQTDTGCTMRSEADVSAVADVTTPVWIYVTDAPYIKGWVAVGGTSVGAPLVAGAFALAGNAKSVPQPQGIWSYAGTAAFNDVTEGTDILPAVTGSCASTVSYICVAQPGYDGPTGWGSPNGVGGL